MAIKIPRRGSARRCVVLNRIGASAALEKGVCQAPLHGRLASHPSAYSYMYHDEDGAYSLQQQASELNVPTETLGIIASFRGNAGCRSLSDRSGQPTGKTGCIGRE
jgi:hypothetical protein